MPNHKHIRRRTFPDHHESGQKIYCDDSEQKLSALHAPTTCSSAVSNDIPPLGHLFLLADQVLHEKEAKNSNEQGPRHREKAPGKKSRIKATNNRRASPKGPKESTELHSGKSSRGRYVRSPRSSMRNIPSDAACVSTRESGASGSVAREKTVETGAVSFDSSTDEHQSKAVRSDRLDSLVPKTVTITKEQEMRLGSSSSEVADDAAEFVLTSGDSSERSNGEIELSSLSAEQKAATKQAPVFLATTKSALAAQLEKVPSTSVTIEEEVDDKANSVSNTEKRQSLSPEEISIAESISYRAFNRSAFVTRTAVKKLCEKRGCWIDGEVADCEGAASAICRVQFDRDGLAEDSVRIRSTPKDLDLLEKMVKLGRVRPGARVNIYRPEDDSFYPAMVLQERLQNRKAFFVQYDDGESEWINLWFHKFEVLSDGPVRKKPKTIAKETSRHGSKDSILKKTKGEKDAKGSERLKTTISKGLEKLTAPHVVGRTPPEEVLHSMNSTSLQEGAKNEKPDPYLVNKKDTDKSCRSRKEEVKDSHNWSISLTRTRGRNDAAITKAKDEDENANVSAAETRIESASARKTDKKKVKKTETCVTEKTAIGDVKLTESKRGCPRILEVVSRDTLISSNIETKPVDFISNSSTLTESKRGRPRKSDTVAREPLMSCNTEKKSAIEVNSESDNIDFMPPKESGTKLRTKGKRSDTDLCDTDSVQSNDLEVEDKVTKSHREKEVAVGDRVGIYWEGDKKYYYGKVTKHEKGKKKPFFLEYDDDDSEWIDFSKSTYRFEKKKKIPVTPNVTDKSSPSIGTIVKSKHDKSKADAALIQPPLRTMRRSMNVTEAMNATELYTDTRKKRSPVVDQAPSTRKKQKVSTDTDFTDLIANEVAKIKVGTRVAVFWPDDNRYYKGVVSRKQPEATWRPFFLEYDDGEEEWIDFRQHKFKILPVVADEERAVSSAGKADYPCSDPSKVWIGTRLSVWWPREEEYFECTVTRYRDHKRSFYLEYEDGDREWIDLAEHKFFIIENGSSERRRAGTRTRSL